MRDEQATFTLEDDGGLPTMEMRQREDGTIEFRYLVEEEQYPGFDDHWRVVSEREQRDHLRMGGERVTFYDAPNKSLERTARQLACHQRHVVSLRLRLAGGQPLNSSVRLLLSNEVMPEGA